MDIHQGTASVNPGKTGAKVASWETKNPRALLLQIIKDNPHASENAVFGLFLSEVHEDTAYWPALCQYWFRNNYAATLRDTPEHKEQAQAPKKESEAVVSTHAAKLADKVVAKVDGIALLSLVQANGKQLRDCTGKTLLAFHVQKPKERSCPSGSGLVPRLDRTVLVALAVAIPRLERALPAKHGIGIVGLKIGIPIFQAADIRFVDARLEPPGDDEPGRRQSNDDPPHPSPIPLHLVRLRVLSGFDRGNARPVCPPAHRVRSCSFWVHFAGGATGVFSSRARSAPASTCTGACCPARSRSAERGRTGIGCGYKKPRIGGLGKRACTTDSQPPARRDLRHRGRRGCRTFEPAEMRLTNKWSGEKPRFSPACPDTMQPIGGVHLAFFRHARSSSAR